MERKEYLGERLHRNFEKVFLPLMGGLAVLALGAGFFVDHEALQEERSKTQVQQQLEAAREQGTYAKRPYYENAQIIPGPEAEALVARGEAYLFDMRRKSLGTYDPGVVGSKTFVRIPYSKVTAGKVKEAYPDRGAIYVFRGDNEQEAFKVTQELVSNGYSQVLVYAG